LLVYIACPQWQITPAKRFSSKCYRTSFGLERYPLSAGRGKLFAKRRGEMRKMSHVKALVLVGLVSVWSFGCATVSGLWSEAQKVGTMEAYEAFLKQYPKSEYASQARNRLNELYETREWQRAKQEDTIAAYENFLARYAGGAYGGAANIRLETLRYDNAKAKDDLDLYADFLRRYPNSAFKNLVLWREEVLLFKRAQSINTIAAYEDFLKRFPNGAYTNQARALTAKLNEAAAKEKERLARAAKQEQVTIARSPQGHKVINAPTADEIKGRQQLVLSRIIAEEGDGSNVKVTLEVGRYAKRKTGPSSASDPKSGVLISSFSSGEFTLKAPEEMIIVSEVSVITRIQMPDTGISHRVEAAGGFFVNNFLDVAEPRVEPKGKGWDWKKKGAVHIIKGRLTMFDYEFDSDPTQLLTFKMTNKGYVYLSGVGTVKDLKSGDIYTLKR
jgi:outer membrane protein assembly factor BamD (BamD/ComL family)